jgi:hypothetical protein
VPKKNTAYVAVTVLFCIAIMPGAIMDIVQPDMVVELMEKISMPMYLLTLLGVWKLLGVLTLAVPKLDRFKEWAYAGFFFDLTGAAYSHAAGGDPAGVVPPLVILSLLLASYFLRRASVAD